MGAIIDAKTMPVNKAKCATCPFRIGGWEGLRPLLEARALTSGMPVCHSTGPDALVPRKKNLGAESLCRGARDFQLAYFVSIGFLVEPTDAAWQAKREELGV